MLYLCRQDVVAICGSLDPVKIVRECLSAHARGATVLPAEAYLRWTNGLNEQARSLNMPSWIGGDNPVAGTKIINSNPQNWKRELPRASGLTVLFDCDTARPECVMDASFISSLRTACVTSLSIELMAVKPVRSVLVIGAGALGEAHLKLLRSRHASIEFSIFDATSERAEALRNRLMGQSDWSSTSVRLVSDLSEAVGRSDVVVAVTTASEGYLRSDWLQTGALVVNVSLDDVLPEVVLTCGRLIVDDWALIKADEDRLLGRMYREGLIADYDAAEEESPRTGRQIDAELGEVICGSKAGRTHPDETILVNPFGLSIEDVAVAAAVFQRATEMGIGTALEP